MRRQLPAIEDSGASTASTATETDSASVATAAPEAAPVPLEPVEPPAGVLVMAMGGVGSSPEQSAEVLVAVEQAIRALADGRVPLDAAALAVSLLEDDPSFNAGTGSALRLGALAPEMDAAVMDATGRYGAVIAIEQVRNPVLVALRVSELPQPVLVGRGATAFAQLLGMAPYDPTTAARREERSGLLAELEASFARRRAQAVTDAGTATVDGGPGRDDDAGAAGGAGTPTPDGGAAEPADALDGGSGAWWLSDAGFDWEAYASWLAEQQRLDAGTAASRADEQTRDAGADLSGTAEGAPGAGEAAGPRRPGADTVAVLVRGTDGSFAGAVSSGGPVLALPGRLGDLAVPGGALHVGVLGAVAVSGPAERIASLRLARRIYERLERTRSAALAAEWGEKQLEGEGSASIVVLDARKGAFRSNLAMAWATRSATETNTGMPEDAGAPGAPPDAGTP